MIYRVITRRASRRMPTCIGGQSRDSRFYSTNSAVRARVARNRALPSRSRMRAKDQFFRQRRGTSLPVDSFISFSRSSHGATGARVTVVGLRETPLLADYARLRYRYSVSRASPRHATQSKEKDEPARIIRIPRREYPIYDRPSNFLSPFFPPPEKIKEITLGVGNTFKRRNGAIPSASVCSA